VYGPGVVQRWGDPEFGREPYHFSHLLGVSDYRGGFSAPEDIQIDSSYARHEERVPRVGGRGVPTLQPPKSTEIAPKLRGEMVPRASVLEAGDLSSAGSPPGC